MSHELDALMTTWQRPLVALFMAWGASGSDGASLAQDTFVEAWLGRDRCRFELSQTAEAGPWLRGIAKNLWRAHVRKRRRERPLAAAPEPETDSGAEGPDHDELLSAVAQLPELQREAIWVRYLEDRSAPEAAALLGIDDHALAGRLWRARVTLKTLMTDRGLAPTAPKRTQP